MTTFYIEVAAREVNGQIFPAERWGGAEVTFSCPKAAGAERDRLAALFPYCSYRVRRDNNSAPSSSSAPIVDNAWHERELMRYIDGIYEPTPWHGEHWYLDKHIGLFAYMSRKSPGMISFTENNDKGVRDIQAQGMAPGRFLTKYFTDALTATEVEQWAAKASEAAGLITLSITQDADEIEEVYENGPRSCMAGGADNFEGPCHPARVYAGPDLAVVYLGDTDDATARCVVWPEKKIHSAPYGDVSRMRLALADAGYTAGSLSGAKVRAISAGSPDCYVMPYVDGICHASVDDSDDSLLILGQGYGIECNNTSGVSGDTRARCEHCGDGMDEDDSYYIEDAEEQWCESCTDHHATHCDYSGNRYQDGVEEVHGLSDYTYVHSDYFSRLSIVYVENMQEYWHRDEVFYCDDCSEYFHNDDAVHHEDADGYIEATTCQSCAEPRHETKEQERIEAEVERPAALEPELPMALCA